MSRYLAGDVLSVALKRADDVVVRDVERGAADGEFEFDDAGHVGRLEPTEEPEASLLGNVIAGEQQRIDFARQEDMEHVRLRNCRVDPYAIDAA